MTEFCSGQPDNPAASVRDYCTGDLTKGRYYIKDWSDNLCNDIIAYGISQGMDEVNAKRLVDPSAITMIHKAMLYDKSKTAVKEKVAKKVIKAPKKAVSKADTPTKTTNEKLENLKTKAEETGSVEDVTKLLAALE